MIDWLLTQCREVVGLREAAVVVIQHSLVHYEGIPIYGNAAISERLAKGNQPNMRAIAMDFHKAPYCDECPMEHDGESEMHASETAITDAIVVSMPCVHLCARSAAHTQGRCTTYISTFFNTPPPAYPNSRDDPLLIAAIAFHYGKGKQAQLTARNSSVIVGPHIIR